MSKTAILILFDQTDLELKQYNQIDCDCCQTLKPSHYILLFERKLVWVLTDVTSSLLTIV